MKISRLIKLLQEKQLDHGNIEVKFPVLSQDKRLPELADVSNLEYVHIGLVNERFILVNYEKRKEG